MADLNDLQTINVGITANDGTGDTIRNSFIKVNQNFDLLKSYLVEKFPPGSLSIGPGQLPDLIRTLRDQKLVELDQIVMNPLRYAAYSDQYKQALSVYRQNLLDVPQQAGFPVDIVWPVIPQPH